MKIARKRFTCLFLSLSMALSIGVASGAEESSAQSFGLTGYAAVDTNSSTSDQMANEPIAVSIEGTDLTTTADEKGRFEFTKVPQNLDGYKLKFTKRNCLQRIVEDVTVMDNTEVSTEKEPIKLWTGDIPRDGAKDNSINLSDVMSIAVAFNTNSGEKLFNKDCDLNFDKSVNMSDVICIAKNFNKTPNDYRKHFSPLPVIGSFEKLKKMVPQSSGSYYYINGVVDGIPVPAALPTPAASKTESSPASGGSTTDYSRTNNQVEGVDEADIVQTDGEYIYQVSARKIIVTKAYPADKMQVIDSVYFENSFTPAEMLIGDNKLVVIGSSNEKVTLPQTVSQQTASQQDSSMQSAILEAQKFGKIMIPTYFYQPLTKVVVLDIKDKSNIKTERIVDVQGRYISSRKIGSSLYVSTNKDFSSYIVYGDSELVKPAYRDSLQGDKFIEIGYDKINYFPEIVRPNYLTVAGININDSSSKVNVSSYLGSGDKMYVSEGNIYIAETGYYSRAIFLANVDFVPAVMPRINSQNTLIYKFAISNGESKFTGKGEVPGRILNQFSMDESKGYFRIATTSTSTTDYRNQNNLYVMDDAFKVTGKIENIAPGETIHSVRFMGNRGYMVTFKNTDPLFVFDLKNPENPVILGELKIPGYSDYLHPYDENHVIGFGKDTIEASADFAWYQGIKVALFDITDVNNPVEKFKEIIGDRGTDSELLRNHKALLFSKSKNLIAFPISLYEVTEEQKKQAELYSSSAASAYGKFKTQAAYIYNIDIENGFKLKGTITHMTDESKDEYGYIQSNNFINRIMYINDTLYTLSNNQIKANKMDDLKEISKVDIPQASPTPNIYYTEKAVTSVNVTPTPAAITTLN